MKKLVKVVGAIIENNDNEILCALRSPVMSLPNLREFPGGKIEEGEGYKEAIEREIAEELDCNVEFTEVFNDNTHEYDKFIVNLVTVKCRLTSGTPIGLLMSFKEYSAINLFFSLHRIIPIVGLSKSDLSTSSTAER